MGQPQRESGELAGSVMIDRGVTEDVAGRGHETSRTRIWLGVVVLWLSWGSVYVGMATSAETMPPLLAAAGRFFLAGIVLAVLGARRLPVPSVATRREWRSAAVIAALCLLLGTGGVVVAVRYVASGTVALLVATVPLWVAVIERVWLGRRVSALATVGLAVGFIGTALVVTQSGAGSVEPIWALVIVVCSGAWALGTVYAARARQAASPSLATGMQMVIGAGMVLMLGVAVGELRELDLGAISIRSLAGWTWMLVMGAIVGYGVAMWLLRVATPALVATSNYVNPIVAVLLGWLLLNEPIGGRTVVAGLLVVLGVGLIVSGRTTRTALPAN